MTRAMRAAAARDWLAGTPHHKHVRARLDEGQRFLILCIVCGVLCGLAAVGFHLAIKWVFTALFARAVSFGDPYTGAILVAAPALAGLVVGIEV